MRVLLISLVLIFIFVVLSATMTLLHYRNVENSPFSKYWMILSCAGIVFMIGTLFVMLKGSNTQAQPEAGEAAAVQNQESQTTTTEQQVSSSKDQQDLSVQSFDYLTAILEALKKGEPIPDKYLQMLPETDRAALKQGQTKPTTSSQTGTNSGAVSLANTNNAGWSSNKNNTGSTNTQTASSGTSTVTNPKPQTGNTTPVQQPAPTNQTGSGTTTGTGSSQPSQTGSQKVALAENSPILQTLYKSQQQVRGYFQSVYAQPLQQGTDRDLYLTGDLMVEVKYASNKASTVTILYESLYPKGKDRSFWENEFRDQAGMDNHAPTFTSGITSTWNGVYAGVTTIQITIDLNINRGMIQAW